MRYSSLLCDLGCASSVYSLQCECHLFLHLSAASKNRRTERTSAFSFVVTQRAVFGNENNLRNCDAVLKLTVPSFTSASKLSTRL